VVPIALARAAPPAAWRVTNSIPELQQDSARQQGAHGVLIWVAVIAARVVASPQCPGLHVLGCGWTGRKAQDGLASVRCRSKEAIATRKGTRS